MYLPRFTIPLQLHHHTVRYVPARGHNPSTSTSPYCALRFCPGSQSFYKYITILHYTSLPGVTIPLQVYHHALLYVSARGHNPSTSTSPCCTIRLCPGSQCFYKFITMLYFTSLSGVTIILHVHHHTVLYISARGHNPSTSTSPYIILGHRLRHITAGTALAYSCIHYCLGPHLFDKYITIVETTSLFWFALLQVNHHTVLWLHLIYTPTTLLSTSLSGVTILLQVHNHTARYATDMDHTSSINNSSCSTSLPFANLFCKCITIPHSTSLPWTTLPLQVLHFILHSTTLLWFALFRHNHAQRHCPSWNLFHMWISLLHTMPLPWVTILWQVHNLIARCVIVLGLTSFTNTSPYCTLCYCDGSHFYRYITILHSTSLDWITLVLQVHHHTAPCATVLDHTTTITSRHSTYHPGSHQHVTCDHGWLHQICNRHGRWFGAIHVRFWAESNNFAIAIFLSSAAKCH